MVKVHVRSFGPTAMNGSVDGRTGNGLLDHQFPFLSRQPLHFVFFLVIHSLLKKEHFIFSLQRLRQNIENFPFTCVGLESPEKQEGNEGEKWESHLT